MDAAKIKSFTLPAALLRGDAATGHGAAPRTDGAELAAVVAAAAAFDTLLAEAGSGDAAGAALPEPMPRNGVIVNLSSRSTGIPPEAHALAAQLDYTHLKPGLAAAAQAAYARPAAVSETPREHDDGRRSTAVRLPVANDAGASPRETPTAVNVAVSPDQPRTDSQAQPAPFAAALQAVMPPAAGIPAKVEDSALERARIAERLAAITPQVEGASLLKRVPFGKLLFAAVAIAAVLLVLLV